MTDLILKRASASRPSGEWNDDDDFDVQADGIVVGRILRVHAAPAGMPWMWTLAFGHHEVPHAHTRLRCDARGRDGCVREGLAAGVGQLKPTTEVEATSILPSLNVKTARS